MAWYGRRRSGEPRVGARAVVVGLGISMVGVLAIQTSTAVRGGIDASRESMDGVAANLASFSSGITGWSFGGFLAALAVLRRPDAPEGGMSFVDRRPLRFAPWTGGGQ